MHGEELFNPALCINPFPSHVKFDSKTKKSRSAVTLTIAATGSQNQASIEMGSTEGSDLELMDLQLKMQEEFRAAIADNTQWAQYSRLASLVAWHSTALCFVR